MWCVHMQISSQLLRDNRYVVSQTQVKQLIVSLLTTTMLLFHRVDNGKVASYRYIAYYVETGIWMYALERRFNLRKL